MKSKSVPSFILVQTDICQDNPMTVYCVSSNMKGLLPNFY